MTNDITIRDIPDDRNSGARALSVEFFDHGKIQLSIESWVQDESDIYEMLSKAETLALFNALKEFIEG